MRKLLLLIFLAPCLTASPAMAQTPGLVRWASGSSTQDGSVAGGGPASSYTFRLPEPARAGNAIVACVVSDDSSNTAGITDDIGANTWISVTTATDSINHMKAHLWVALNVAAGTRTITPTFAATYPQKIAVTGAEFYNIAGSSAVDGSSVGTSASGSSTMSSAPITASQANDLIYQCGVRSQTPLLNVTNPYTAGSGFTLQATDNWDGLVSQWQVKAAAGVITPSLMMTNASGYATAAVALKASAIAQGSPRSPGMQIVGIEHINVASSTATANGALATTRYQLANTGNLIVASVGPGNDTHAITAMTDSNSRSWISTGPVLGDGNAGKSQRFYLGNATPTSNLSITANWSSCASPGTNCDHTILLYDIEGAAASPFVQHYSDLQNTGGGIGSGQGCLGTSCVTPYNNVAPGTSSGMGFGQLSVAFNTVCGTTHATLVSPSGGLCDSFSYGTPGTDTPLDGPEPVDQNNGWFHYTFGTSANQTWTIPFQKTAQIAYYASTLDFFKAAPNGVNPPSGLNAVVQ